jgi:hypothetical protein
MATAIATRDRRRRRSRRRGQSDELVGVVVERSSITAALPGRERAVSISSPARVCGGVAADAVGTVIRNWPSSRASWASSNSVPTGPFSRAGPYFGPYFSVAP